MGFLSSVFWGLFWYYVFMRYTTILTKEKKLYVARRIELGVVSQGKTVEEAQRNLKEATGLYLTPQLA